MAVKAAMQDGVQNNVHGLQRAEEYAANRNDCLVVQVVW